MPENPLLQIRNHFQTHPLFNTLRDETLSLLAEQVRTLSLSAGETLFREGDHGSALYTIIEGQLGVFLTEQSESTDKPVAKLGAGETVGEIAMLTGAVRTATINALQETTLIEVQRAVFDSVAEQDPQALHIIANKIRERLHKNQMLKALAGLFGPLASDLQQAFIENGRWLFLAGGDQLWSQGDAADSFYLVVSGRLHAIVEDPGGHPRVAAVVGSGDPLGEMGALTGEPRTATIQAMRDSALIAFSAKFFNDIIQQHPNLLRQVTNVIIRRLQGVQDKQRRHRLATQLVILQLSTENSPFAFQLTKAIRSLGASVIFISKRVFNTLVNIPHAAQLPLDDPNNVRLQAWLDEQEAQFDYVVYQIDGTASNWGKRVLQRADLVLSIAKAGDDPGLRPIEAVTKTDPQISQEITQSLVLVHPERLPSFAGTASWLAPRSVRGHYHIVAEDEKDIGRLARHLTQRAVGVVLSGGGARGFAHIGVLKALEEAGVPIDFISGVSAGALVAGLYGIGLSFEQITQEFFRLTKNPVDITLPLVSMIRGRKLARRMRDMFGEVQIEDLPTPVFCVSSNLSNATTFVHSKGSLWQAVLASNTPVGFAPPVVVEGQLLMDGNALDNLPADIMAEIINGGPVIAVDVSRESDLELVPSYGPEGLSGWRVLWSRLNPLSPAIKLPSTLSLIMRSQELGSLAQSRHFQDQYIDFYIDPPVESYPVLDYAKGRELVQVGFQDALKKLEKWGDRLPRIDE